MDYREALLLEAFRLLKESHQETVLAFVAELADYAKAEQQQQPQSRSVH